MSDRLANLQRQVSELLRGNVAVAARADGARVITADSAAVGGAMRLALSELRREVPFDSCSVQELRGDRLVIVGGVGFADLDVLLGESFDIASNDAPNGEVVYRRKPLIVADTEQYRAFRRGLHVGEGIRSWLGVPVMHGEQLLGMIALDKAEPDFYTQEHAAMAMRFATLVAMALAAAGARHADGTTG